MANKPHYEGSESIYTNNYHSEKETEHTKEKEQLSTIIDSDILVKYKLIKHLTSLHLHNKVIKFTF